VERAMSKHEPFVSIVTPVFNGQHYLRECVESVLAQTHENWDYTIVNNRSTDGTLDIARAYAAKDSRIRVHDNETFVRVNANYNIAFRQISPLSKYTKVVAADDWLFPECVERLVRLAEDHPKVAIVGSYALMGSRVAGNGLPYSSSVLPGRAVCRMRLLGGLHVFGTATMVLFRSDIVRSRHAFYNESNFHADAEACYEFLEHADFGFVHQVLSFLRTRDDSLTSFSERFQTYLPETLYNLAQYGSKYLAKDELERRQREVFRNYYAYLAGQLYERRDAEFWSFHKDKLSALGHPLSAPRLATAAASLALDVVLNPLSTAKRVARRVRRTFSKSDPGP
jgi:glycosyltransferase involved in cell wall biosynthesis